MILRIAILSVPLRRAFDYLPPAGGSVGGYRPGIRVKVPFGKQQRIGILLETTAKSDIPEERLKPVTEIIDSAPLLPESLHSLLLRSASYYHHAIGEVYETALPVPLRQGRYAKQPEQVIYRITERGIQTDLDSLSRAPRQRQLLERLQQERELSGSSTFMRELIKKGLVVRESRAGYNQPPKVESDAPHQLNGEQQQAVDVVHKQMDGAGNDPIRPVLLEGVTGSGKTEVYLQIIQRVIDDGRQALVLVPEISLTPQTVQRFRQRFDLPIALLHSGRNSSKRLGDWLAARAGGAKIVIGTRSAVFVPLQSPGIIIVDEEHDGSFKQHEGFRYSARDLAILRGKQEGIPVLLGSATPSFESLHNAESGKYRKLLLSSRAGGAKPPEISLIDVRSRKMEHLLSAPLIEKMREHLEQDGQILIFLNRRGYAPTLFCRGCGWSSACPRCEIHYTFHQKKNRLVCHHCGGERPRPPHCPECGSHELTDIGAGTERIEEALQKIFPEHSVARIDRDTTRRRGSMDEKLQQIHAGDHQILLGTQMLAKGHHFPKVTLVAILDADSGLFGSDFRATEQMGQLITQVAGRAGRESMRGEVAIQTHNPDHPLLLTLLQRGYPDFAKQALAERKLAALPPYSHLTLIRAESSKPQAAIHFLQQVREMAVGHAISQVEILGPVPSPMEKRAGRYRAQLLLQSSYRKPLHQLLAPLIPAIESTKEGRKVRWSVDVDPIDMF